jgi:hypothetical protein
MAEYPWDPQEDSQQRVLSYLQKSRLESGRLHFANIVFSFPDADPDHHRCPWREETAKVVAQALASLEFDDLLRLISDGLDGLDDYLKKAAETIKYNAAKARAEMAGTSNVPLTVGQAREVLKKAGAGRHSLLWPLAIALDASIWALLPEDVGWRDGRYRWMSYDFPDHT